MSDTARPTVILGMPADNGIYRLISDGLRHHGFQVISAVMDNQAFRYPSAFSRLKVKFAQTVLRDRDAKRKLKSKLLLADVRRQIAEAGGADYALFIRGDIYSNEFLRTIKSQVRHQMVNYQWDGLARHSEILDSVGLFDKCYVFDPADLSADRRFLPATNFYFDHLPPSATSSNGLYFVGLHMPGRTDTINLFAATAGQAELTLGFHIGSTDTDSADLRRQYADTINIFHGVRPFADNLRAAQQATILVDFRNPIHHGLSFRVFEALGYRKKLITDNADITRYDFYHTDNIFVWNGQNSDGLAAFAARPYHEMPSEIYTKYAFGNWIRYMLDIPPYQAISLPEPSRPA
ncbi:hypothetical protein [Neisseria perflava]|uniref:hypothetical protein n=1 Tax=Neisseria perflava TaxID=33053 RepID=UPI0020A0D461|nr:hypothetical protein [Neisseria perflava]MCP1659912.1 hypothetical protein [Neisseria perflava]MCP1772241.1 hypothetical protein [Neisseria perflava]